MKKIFFLLFYLCLGCTLLSNAQIGFKSGLFKRQENNKQAISYQNPKEYVIDSIRVDGISYLNQQALISLSGLKVGDKVKIPSVRLSDAIKKLWKQGLLGSVGIYAEELDLGKATLVIKVTERPRLSKIVYEGLSKTHQSDIDKKVDLILGRVLTDALISNAKLTVKKFLWSKGFRNATIEAEMKKHPKRENSVILLLKVNKKSKIKINEIKFTGIKELTPSNLKSVMKGTKEHPRIAIISNLSKVLKTRVYNLVKGSDKKTSFKNIKDFIKKSIKPNFFISSKFIEDDYKDDRNAIITLYNSHGFRDAKILSDTVYNHNHRTLDIEIDIEEGQRYYHRNIEWKGNFIYKDKILSQILGIEKGDVYDLELINKKLNYNPTGTDISSLYMDSGYLFFRITPVEKRIVGDSIDLEMRIYEGKQATINKVILKGNDRTSDKVIRREIRTLPGEIYSRSNVIRTHREIAALDYFNPETIDIKPLPNPANDTVDIQYTVEEKSSDEIQISGGWGGAVGFVGTLGFSLKNFSIRNIKDKSKWKPLPSGDGQRLTFRIQANGLSYQNYSASFLEPWLGGKKPNSFSVSISHAIYRTGGTRYDQFGRIISSTGNFTGSLYLTSLSLGLGRRVNWPDDYFSLSHSFNMLFYRLNNFGQSLGFSTGDSRNFNIRTVVSRNSSGPSAIFPLSGSDISLSLTLTPPYSLFNGLNYEIAKPEEKYEWVEYHKWMFDFSNFTSIIGKLVLASKIHFGFIGSYKKETGVGPFERFVLGGAGLAGSNILVGNDIVGLRGYRDNTVTPPNFDGSRSSATIVGGVAFHKYVMELRYPVSLNPSATVYLLSFMEAGNNWYTYEDINLNRLYKSTGFGVRIFMPAFGLIGFDWAYGHDVLPSASSKSGSQFHFTIGNQIR